MLNKLINKVLKKINHWEKLHGTRLVTYNIIIVFLFLLRSAGYFNPFFPITVNFIVLFGIMLSIFLLGARSSALFAITIIFWLFAGLLQLFQINVWAERTGIYAYESLVLAVSVFIYESLKSNYRSRG